MYLWDISKVFSYAQREKNMDISLKTDEKKNKFRKKKQLGGQRRQMV